MTNEVCQRFGAEFVPPHDGAKLGIALETLHIPPLNAMRISPDGTTCGWYIWGGEFSEDADFFKPLHFEHLSKYAPSLVSYLGLAPGWRILLAPGQEDVWFDSTLLK